MTRSTIFTIHSSRDDENYETHQISPGCRGRQGSPSRCIGMAGVHHGQDRTTIQACRFRHASRLLSVCQPQPITAPGRVNCKTALHDTGGNNPWRCRSQAVRQIHLNRSRASHPTLISMTQRTRFVRDLNALHHPLIETRDRLLCKPCGAFC